MTHQTLTPKQKDLIQLTFSFRYINRLQFQIYLNHKSPRQINKHLKKLTELKYLKKVKDSADYPSSYTHLATPSIFCLGGKGITFIVTLRKQNPQELKNRYKDSTRSQIFINHHLTLTGIFIELLKESRNKSSTLTFQTKEDYEEGSVLELLHPDAYIVKKSKNNTQTFLIDIINPTTPSFIMKRRVRVYIKAFVNNTLESETGEDFPIVLCICPTQSTQTDFARYIRRTLKFEDIEGLIYKLTTQEKVIQYGVTRDIWRPVIKKDKKRE
jgi:hypothetical protein